MLPLCIPQVNWPVFIQAVQDSLGFSPTRGLDDVLLPKHNDPAAFLACLDLKNKPAEALLKHELYKHYSLSFIASLSDFTILEFSNWTTLHLYCKKDITILSGTLADWRDAVIYGCSNEAHPDLRRQMNKAHQHLCTMGFKSIFPQHQTSLHDGTYILK